MSYTEPSGSGKFGRVFCGTLLGLWVVTEEKYLGGILGDSFRTSKEV